MQPIQRRSDPGKKALWLTVGVLSALVAVLMLALLEKEESSVPPEARREWSTPSTALPPERQAPSVDTTPIVVAGQGGEGCEAEEPVFDVTVMAVGERTTPDASEQPVYLQNQESVVRKYYLDNDSVPAAEKPRLADMFVVGRRLKVRYVVCGSGGFRYLTFVQPTATG
ncbi:hypothetical protein [Methylomagnum sp.]